MNKLRIISGKYKRLLINSVGLPTTRETTDKVRETIFNLLGQYFTGGIGLDLFSGSGALGIEALSRGLDKVYFSDCNLQAINTINFNLKSLKIAENQYEVFKMDYKEMILFLKKKKIKLDYIFLDPPYDEISNSEILTLLVEHDIIHKNGLIIVEQLKNIEINFLNEFKLYKKKNISIRDILIVERI